MTPKQKAEELVDKMYQYQWRKDTIEFRNAKQCASIVVEEILEECRLERYHFWQKVKLEINKL